MTFKLPSRALHAFAGIGLATTLAATAYGTTAVVREALDPRNPDAYDTPLMRECVGDNLIFTYRLKNGEVQTTYVENAPWCGAPKGADGDVRILSETPEKFED